VSVPLSEESHALLAVGVSILADINQEGGGWTDKRDR